jgi:hypothetical protein
MRRFDLFFTHREELPLVASAIENLEKLKRDCPRE